MAGGLPESIDALRLVSSQSQLSGRIELSRLRRLCELLSEADGTVAVELQAGRSPGGQTTLEGRVQATLQLRCQRCLEALPLPVDAQVAVALVEDEAQADEVPAPFEPVTLAGGIVPLQDLIEDELLLRIPFAPVHADVAECGKLAEKFGAYRPQPRDEEHRPFAKLADELHGRKK